MASVATQSLTSALKSRLLLLGSLRDTSAGLSGHEVGQSRWSFDQGISILLWNNLMQEVVDVSRGQTQEIHPNVATNQELEKQQRKGELVALDAEAKE